MSEIFLRWLTSTAAIIFTSYLLSGIHVNGFPAAFFAAAMLGILNALFRPIALLITLPINILTLGLFTFVINALMLEMASGVISGFEVHGFGSAVLGSFLISVISWVLNSFFDRRGTRRHVDFRRKGRHKNPLHPRRDDAIDLKHKGDDRWE